MGKVTDLGSLPPDDPMFLGGPSIFSPGKFKPSTKTLPPAPVDTPSVPVKRFGIVSYHYGELESDPDATTTVSFSYFRGKSPKDSLEPTPKLPGDPE